VLFDEDVFAGTGDSYIYIKRSSDDTTIEAMNANWPGGGGPVTFSGTSVTINPNSDLPAGTAVYVEIRNGAIKDGCDNYFPGISDKTVWNFTTVSADSSPPQIVSLGPADNSNDVVTSTNLTMVFDENVYQGSGMCTIQAIKTSDSSVLESFTYGDLSGWGTNTITINPDTDFPTNTPIHITVSQCFKDSSENYFVGFADSTTWNFTTASNPEIASTSPGINEPAYNLVGLKLIFNSPMYLDYFNEEMICRLESYTGTIVNQTSFETATISADGLEVTLPNFTLVYYGSSGSPVYCSIAGSVIKSQSSGQGRSSDYQFQFLMPGAPTFDM
jgi:hypothetical protein